MRGYGKSQKAYEKAKKDYKKKTGFSTVGEKMKSKGYTPPKSNNKDNQIIKDIDEAQKQKDNTEKAKDQASLNVGAGTGSGMQTTDFLDDLKEAYKAGLFSSGTKGKAFMDKYNLKPGELGKLRSSIDMGLGSRIGDGGNVLTDIVKDLRQEGILRTSGPGAEFLQQRASDIYEPGMKKSNMFLPFEDPQNIFQKGANLATQFNPFLNLVSGIFGSSAGQRATYFGREKGLEGEELDQFAASVANDRNLYNQMMATPLMQDYELNEFRAEANKNAMAQRRGGDPDPISGSQGEEGGESGDGTTDPGTDPVYTPPPQNYFTFFDPNLGRYRSGTYDEYLQYVTAKDGGIIQLQEGGTPPNAPGGVLPQGRKEQLEDLLTSLQEISDIKPNPKFSSEQEGKTMLMDDVNKKMNELLRNIKGNPTTVGLSGEAVKMAEEDQPAKGILNIDVPSDSGPALRDELSMMGKVKDSGLSLLMEALRKSDITEGSANQFIEEALNNFVAAGIIPPNTSYDQLTDPFKDLVTREASMIANSMAKNISYLQGEDMESMQMKDRSFPMIRNEGPISSEPNITSMPTADRVLPGSTIEEVELPARILRGKDPNDYMVMPPSQINNQADMYNVADGGIIGLKDGGMNDMMEADSLMFKDPSDEGEWEYNV